MMMAEGPGKVKLKSSDFKFKPVKAWLGGDVTERIEGWRTRLYEATGKMKTVDIEKVLFIFVFCLFLSMGLPTSHHSLK